MLARLQNQMIEFEMEIVGGFGNVDVAKSVSLLRMLRIRFSPQLHPPIPHSSSIQYQLNDVDRCSILLACRPASAFVGWLFSI